MTRCRECGHDHDRKDRSIREFYSRVVPVMIVVSLAFILLT